MANSTTGIQDDIIARSVLQGFTAAIAPMAALNTLFSDAAANRGDRVSVPRLASNLDAAEDKTVGAAYTIQDIDSDAVEIVLNKHKYVSMGNDDIEVANSSALVLERYGVRKGNLLAKTVVQDIFSEITAANFGSAAFTGAASTFDEDDVADIADVCDDDNMPEGDRYLVLSNAYITALRKSGAIKDTAGYGFNAIQSGQIPMLHGFKIIPSNIIPSNDQNLVGFATDGSGIASAFRYLAPLSGNKYDRAEAIVGEGGITLGLRSWYSEDYGNYRSVMECVYGYKTGLAAGIKRLVSA
jgi:hypothetical protein